jgi:hypothetical protein
MFGIPQHPDAFIESSFLDDAGRLAGMAQQDEERCQVRQRRGASHRRAMHRSPRIL